MATPHMYSSQRLLSKKPLKKQKKQWKWLPLLDKRVYTLQHEIALQDGNLDNPAFIQRRTSEKMDRHFPTSANIPFQSPSMNPTILLTFTLEARTSIFTLML
jgi:hypothetical protein